MKMCKRLCVAMLIITFCLSGCGQSLPKVIDRTTVSVGKDGSVTAYLVEKFDKDYYDLSELTDMVMEEAEEYNKGASDLLEGFPVIVKEVSRVKDNDNLVSVVYDFQTAAVYSKFCNQNFFYGSVGEAVLQNKKFIKQFKSVKDNTVMTEEQLLAKTDKKIIITDVKAAIYCPGKVTHISEGAVYNEDGSVDTTAAEGLVYIILK